MLEIGQTAIRKLTYSQADFSRFATISGDDNPIHVDPAFSARTKFGKPVAHGMLMYSSLCAMLSDLIPNPAVIHLSQELMFPSPTFADEPLDLRLEVLDRSESGIVELATTITRPTGDVGCSGKMRILLPGDRLQFYQGSLSTAELASEADRHRGLKLGQQAVVTRVFTGGEWGAVGGLKEKMSSRG